MPNHIAPKVINWASIIEQQAQDQIVQASKMPFIFPHIAVMPDVHLGKGCSVGTVLPTERAIIPAAVGVDIGCGMIAVRTQWTEEEFRSHGSLTPLRNMIEARIPLSAGNYSKELTATAKRRVAYLEDLWINSVNPCTEPWDYAPTWQMQLGSLGSGNHFIEVTVDELSRVWLFLHSGSRGIGNKIAQHHIKAAQAYCQKNWISLPDPDLAYLVQGTREFDSYIKELRWAQTFARVNRDEMMDRVMEAVGLFTGEFVIEQQRINCHHNFTEAERHFGKDLWVSRKGAIKADVGDWGLIPGSMGTASYVVQGLGNKVSFNSSPHGAGREYGRNAAKKAFTYEQLVASMEGIEWSGSAAFLDEIPSAYKDVDVVMADAASLVEIKHTLHQILNVKGS